MNALVVRVLTWLLGTIPGKNRKMREEQKRHSDKIKKCDEIIAHSKSEFLKVAGRPNG